MVTVSGQLEERRDVSHPSILESVHLQPPWTKLDLEREMKEIMTLATMVGVGSWY